MSDAVATTSDLPSHLLDAIRDLREDEVPRDRFGTKAHALSVLHDNRVPRAFALDLGGLDDSEIEAAASYVWDQFAETDLPLIVRSSAGVEDVAPFMFPGRFASKRDVRLLIDLINGITLCRSYASGEGRVRDYGMAHGLAEMPSMDAVLIQQQVPAEYAGVIFTASPRPFQDHRALIELCGGTAADLLQGKAHGALYGIDPGPPEETYVHLAGRAYPIADVHRVIDAVLQECSKVEESLKEPQDIEWVWTGQHAYVVQVRPTRPVLYRRQRDRWPTPHVGSSSSSAPPPQRELLTEAKKIGQKAAAEKYFQEKACGAANATVIPPRTSRHALERTLSSRQPGIHGSTIRYSHSRDAGLPVRFVEAEQDLAEAYLEHRLDDDHAGIISDFVFVEHSFEAYLDTDTLIVHHVPGNWEPQSRVEPDLFVSTETGTQVWAVQGPRQAVFGLPSSTDSAATLIREVSPITSEEAVAWRSGYLEYLEAARRDFASKLPLNIHFVRSADKWHFLNIRPTKNLEVRRGARSPRLEFKSERFYLTTKLAHLDHWDGYSPILISEAADLSTNARLAELGAALVERKVRDVHSTFGVLTHPALVLREFGIEVHPLYARYRLLAEL